MRQEVKNKIKKCRATTSTKHVSALHCVRSILGSIQEVIFVLASRNLHHPPRCCCCSSSFPPSPPVSCLATLYLGYLAIHYGFRRGRCINQNPIQASSLSPCGWHGSGLARCRAHNLLPAQITHNKKKEDDGVEGKARVLRSDSPESHMGAPHSAPCRTPERLGHLPAWPGPGNGDTESDEKLPPPCALCREAPGSPRTMEA